MTDQRFIIEMGTGNAQYSMDYNKAAGRAIEDALRHSSISMFASLGMDPEEMRVQVTVGVQEPEQLDCDALTTLLPRGKASVRAVKGGLNVVNDEIGQTIVIATAAVEAFLPKQG